MKKILSQSIKAIFLGILFSGISVFATNVFVGPGTSTPSTGNAPIPVNVSAADQAKQGGLSLSRLLIGPGSVTTAVPDVTSASILGNLRIGSGAVPLLSANPAGTLLVNNKLGVGSTVTIGNVPNNAISAAGIVAGGGGLFSGTNIFAGAAAFLTPPAAAGANGAVIADKFCFSGAGGTCIAGAWGGGGATLPAGTMSQTLYYASTGVTVTPTSSMTNDGNTVTVKGTNAYQWGRFVVKNGTLNVDLSSYPATDPMGRNAIAIQTSGTQPAVLISSSPSFQLWGSNGDADLHAGYYYSSPLANPNMSTVCADAVGKLILCQGASTTLTSPQAPSITLPANSTSVNQAITLNWTAQNASSCTATSSPSLSGWNNGTSINAAAGSGTATVTATQFGTYTFTINCNGALGPTSSSVTVTISSSSTFQSAGGTWVVPSGVTTATVVLVGAGGEGGHTFCESNYGHRGGEASFVGPGVNVHAYGGLGGGSVPNNAFASYNGGSNGGYYNCQLPATASDYPAASTVFNSAGYPANGNGGGGGSGTSNIAGAIITNGNTGTNGGGASAIVSGASAPTNALLAAHGMTGYGRGGDSVNTQFSTTQQGGAARPGSGGSGGVVQVVVPVTPGATYTVTVPGPASANNLIGGAVLVIY